MGPLMDIKVFNTNLIRLGLIFNHINFAVSQVPETIE